MSRVSAGAGPTGIPSAGAGADTGGATWAWATGPRTVAPCSTGRATALAATGPTTTMGTATADTGAGRSSWCESPTAERRAAPPWRPTDPEPGDCAASASAGAGSEFCRVGRERVVVERRQRQCVAGRIHAERRVVLFVKQLVRNGEAE